MIGQTLTHYQILEKIGEGGMGVVYKARDTHLDRFVAIKVLPPEKVADPTRKARFVQEAKAASSLNHPNIITVHDITSDDGHDFIVMEYVDGRTLADLIPRHGMKLHHTLKCGAQMADALAAAHANGILHRDLKPSNVMVGDRGLVKVLDFGLAKLTEQSHDAEAPTETMKVRTEEGTVAGTVNYMSPEQAEGKLLDGRSDIFSLGAVLYEMATGRRAFDGESKLSTLTGILHSDPKPVRQLREDLPAELERVISRCLRKDPARRFQHVGDIRVALEELKEESESGTLAAVPRPARRKRLALLAAAALAVAAAAVALWRTRTTTLAPEAEQRAVSLTSSQGMETWPSLSPDGRQVAFVWGGEKQDNADIYVKLIDSTSPPLRLTSHPSPDSYPAWSPDGRWIAFLRSRPGGYEVTLIPPLGGPERPLTGIQISPGYSTLAWTPDSRWLILPDRSASDQPQALFLVSLDSSERRQLTTPPAGVHGDTQPAVSPDGRTLAFVRYRGPGVADLQVLPLTDQFLPAGPSRVVPSGAGSIFFGLAWMPAGLELLCSRADLAFTATSLWRVAPNGASPARRVAAAGDTGPGLTTATLGSSGAVRLVYSRSENDPNIYRVELSAAGGAVAPPYRLIASTLADNNPQYSPDGQRVAFFSARSGSGEIWLADAGGENQRQLTSFGKGHNGTPRWSPDGQWIAFDGNTEGQWELYVISANGGRPRRLTQHPSTDAIPSWSRDGKWIYFASDRSGKFQIWKLPPQGGEPVQVTRDGGHVAFESQDRKTIFYTKDERLTTSLWRMPSAGGAEEPVLDGVYYRGFYPGRSGIWFFSRSTGRFGTDLKFSSFAGGNVRTVLSIEEPSVLGLAVSRDDRSLLFTKADRAGSDLMMIDNFR